MGKCDTCKDKCWSLVGHYVCGKSPHISCDYSDNSQCGKYEQGDNSMNTFEAYMGLGE
jgi:hypothetical protein